MFSLVSAQVARVTDYIEYVHRHPQLIGDMGDLKDVQRPWALETCRKLLPPRALVIDLGGAACELASAMMDDFSIIVVDPYEGHGNGPKSSAPYRKLYPKLGFLEGYLTTETTLSGFDCVVSTSVVEHIPIKAHADTVGGIAKALRTGGYSIHAIDVTLWGDGGFLEGSKLLAENWARAHGVVIDIDAIAAAALADHLTYFLSVQMYNRWRKKRTYDAYPWRKVASLNLVMQKVGGPSP